MTNWPAEPAVIASRYATSVGAWASTSSEPRNTLQSPDNPCTVVVAQDRRVPWAKRATPRVVTSGERARISNSNSRTRCNGRKIHWAIPLAGVPTCTRCARPPCGPVTGLTCTDSLLPSRTHQQAKPWSWPVPADSTPLPASRCAGPVAEVGGQSRGGRIGRPSHHPRTYFMQLLLRTFPVQVSRSANNQHNAHSRKCYGPPR